MWLSHLCVKKAERSNNSRNIFAVALLSLAQFISPERVPSKYFIDEKCYLEKVLSFAKQLLKGALGKVMYTNVIQVSVIYFV